MRLQVSIRLLVGLASFVGSLVTTSVLAQPSGAAPPVLFHVEDPSRIGRPSRIVPPAFPKLALERRLSAHVDVEGRVSPLLSLEEVEFRGEGDAVPLFVDAVKEVLQFWEFYPITDESCFPSSRRIVNRVSFEWVDDQPKVFVTMRTTSASRVKSQILRAVEKAEIRYPRAAVSARASALVYAELTIRPDGSVSQVKTQVYPERRALNRQFESVATSALSKWKFAPAESEDRLACYDIFFKIKD